jgi:hypothetical protein
MTTPRPQGGLTIERLCELTKLARAGYYRHWRASAPRQEQTALRDAIQRIALESRVHRAIAISSTNCSGAMAWWSAIGGCCV